MRLTRKWSKANWRVECLAGVTTFFTMAYIVVVNPSILATPGTNMPFGGVMTATVLLSFLMTLLMGFYADLPFAVAPGMGVNAFFTFTIILGEHVSWPVALGMIFWSGVFFVIISVTPLREKIARGIPKHLRIGASAGIGIFLTLIGLKNLGFIQGDAVTLVKPAPLALSTCLGLAGFAVIVIFMKRKSPFAFLIGIFSVTVAAMLFHKAPFPEKIFAAPDFSSVLFKLDILGALKWSLVPAIISILFTDFFDSISTFMGVAQAGGILDVQGDPKNLKQGLIVDAFATLGAGLLGTSSGTAFIESAAGIEMGGRTGLTSVFTALCFLPCLFLSPLVGSVPAYATAPVLVMVGVLMFRSVSELKFDDLADTIPAFLTTVLIPLSFSITQGILWGFISHVFCYGIFGRAKKITPVMWGLGALSVFLVLLDRGP